jgi:hypothetical protein
MTEAGGSTVRAKIAYSLQGGGVTVHEMTVHDGRQQHHTLDKSGFEVAASLLDDDTLQILRGCDLTGHNPHSHLISMYPHVQRRLGEYLNASKVVAFDHVIRRSNKLHSDPLVLTANPTYRVHSCHGDYTVNSVYVR